MESTKRIILIFLMYLLSFDLCGQEISGMTQYDTDDGLPSSETYRIFADNSGKLWFCTDRGIAYYDSYKFIKIESVIGDDVILDGYCDSKGQLWFQSLKNNIYTIKGGELQLYADVKKRLGININNATTDFFITNDSIYYTIYIREVPEAVYLITKESTKVINKTNLFNGFEYLSKSMQLKVFYDERSYKALFSVNFSKDTIPFQVSFRNKGFDLAANVPVIPNGRSRILQVFKVSENDILINNGQELILFDVYRKTYNRLGSLEYGVGKLTSARKYDQKIFMSTVFNNVLIYNLKSKSFEYLNSNINTMTTSFYNDIEGNVWMTTLSKGLLKKQFIDISTGFTDLNITAIHYSNKKLFIGTKSGEFGEIVKGNFKKIGLKKSKISKIISLNKTEILVQGEKYQNDKYYSVNNINSFNWINDMFFYNGKCFGVGSNNINVFELNGNSYELFYKMERRAYSTYLLNDELYLGHQDGLSILELKSKKNTFLLPTSFRITSIKQFNNYLILTTLGDGVYLFDPKSKKVVKKIRIEEGLSANITYTSIVQNDSTFWVGSNNGINRIILDKNLSLSDIAYFDRSN